MPPEKQPSTSSLAHKIFEQLNSLESKQNKQQEYVCRSLTLFLIKLHIKATDSYSRDCRFG